MVSSKNSGNIIILILLTITVVCLVKYFHFIRLSYLFFFTLIILLFNLYRNVSGIFVFLSFSTAVLITMPNLFLVFANSIGVIRYANLICVISLVILISFIGGNLFCHYRKGIRTYLISILIISLIAAFLFKEPLIFERNLSILYFLLIAIIGICLGATFHLSVNIKKYHTVIFLAILVLAFFLSNYVLKRTPHDVALIECFSEWASTKVDYSAENMSLEGGYSYSLMKKALEHKYNLLSVQDRTKMKETLNRVTVAMILTPTTPMSSEEINDFVVFVENGGRLVVICDHTDLYGHGRVLNALLREMNVSVNYDALFDYKDYYAEVRLLNMPIRSIRPKTPSSIKVGARGYVFAWADNWISETADYTKPNFFGDLEWTSDDLVGNWPVGAIMPHKKGKVVLWGDSTILANFSIFQIDHLKLLGTLLEGGEILSCIVPYCLLLIVFFTFSVFLKYLRKDNVIVFCSLGFVLLSGSYYSWNFDDQKFYPKEKRLDVYGVKHLFVEPIPKRLPEAFQFSSAYSHIARSQLWPLYRGEKPEQEVSVKSIWITRSSQLGKVPSNILGSLWGIVINEFDDETDLGFRKLDLKDDFPEVFQNYFHQNVKRRVWVTQDGSHTSSYKGVPIIAADGVMTDRHLGDWWITTSISPYRQHILTGWFKWLLKKDRMPMFHYPDVGVAEGGQDWVVKFGDREPVNLKMSVAKYKANEDYVYIGAGIWSTYEKNKDGEFLLGGPELTDDSISSGNIRWAARSGNNLGR